MDRLRLRSESGFTLIELLVVVAIIGILAAIAIPQFAAYRRRGYEAQVKSDLRNAATAQEAYFANAFTYKGGTVNAANFPGYNPTTNVTMTSSGGASAFTLTATHSLCASGQNWTFASANGLIAGPSGGCS